MRLGIFALTIRLSVPQTPISDGRGSCLAERDHFVTTPPPNAFALETKRPCFRGFRRADDGTRTHGLLHGKQTLYQLSYIRARPEYSGDLVVA